MSASGPNAAIHGRIDIFFRKTAVDRSISRSDRVTQRSGRHRHMLSLAASSRCEAVARRWHGEAMTIGSGTPQTAGRSRRWIALCRQYPEPQKILRWHHEVDAYAPERI